MLAQYLASQGAANLQKSKTNSVKGVNSPQVNKERIFHVPLLVVSFCTVSPSNTIYAEASAQPCFQIVLIFSPNLRLVFL